MLKVFISGRGIHWIKHKAAEGNGGGGVLPSDFG